MNRAPVILRGLGWLLAGSLLTAADPGEFVSHLDSPRAVERLAALTELARTQDRRAVASAITAMRRHPRWTSGETTAMAGLMQRQELADSVALLNDSHRDVVEAAVIDLGLRPPGELETLVKEMLAGDDARVALAQRILERVVQQGGKTPAHAALALLQFQDAKEQRRVQAVRSLARQETLDHAMVAHIRKDEAPAVRIALTEVLAQHLAATHTKQPEQARWLRRQLHELAADPQNAVRFAAFDELQDAWLWRPQGDTPAEDLALFLTALSDPYHAVRAKVVRRFAWSPLPAAIPLIEKLAVDPEGLVADQALAVVEHLRLPSVADLAFQGCSLPHPQTRRTALRILIETKDARVIPVATRLLDDPDWEVRRNAQAVLAAGNVGSDTGALALARVAKMRPGERQALLVRLSQLDPPQRMQEIARLYAQMMPEQRLEFMDLCARDPSLAANAGEFLVQRTADSDGAIAVLAFKALRGINGRDGKFGVSEALSRLEDRDPKVAYEARYLLSVAVRAGGGGFRWLLPNEYEQRAYQDPDGLPPLPESPQALTEFLANLKTVSPAERARHLIVLGRVDDPRALDALRDAARSPERAIRWAALDALVYRGDQQDATLDHALARLLTTEPDRWTSVVWPVIDTRLLTRLATFSTIGKAVEPAAIAALKAEIERRLAAITAVEVVR
jgi:HEAT repeat protein